MVTVYDVEIGQVLCDPQNEPCRDVARFVAQIIIISNPGSIRQFSTPQVFCNVLRSVCRVQCVLAKVEKKSGEVLKYEPEELKVGEAALVEFVPLRPFPIEDFAKL